MGKVKAAAGAGGKGWAAEGAWVEVGGVAEEGGGGMGWGGRKWSQY